MEILNKQIASKQENTTVNGSIVATSAGYDSGSEEVKEG